MKWILGGGGLIAVNVLGTAAGWDVIDWQWWATVAPLCLLIGTWLAMSK